MSLLLISLSPLLGNLWLVPGIVLFGLLIVLYYGGLLPAKMHKWFFVALVAFLFSRALLLTFLQYLVWSSGPPSSYFLPPHQPISYFLGYSFIHYFATILLTGFFVMFLAGFFFIFRRVARISWEGSFWKTGEEYIFLSGAFILRWPLVIPYLFLGILAAAVYFLFAKYTFKKDQPLLNPMPFFAVSVLPLFYFKEAVLTVFWLKALVMPF